MSTPVTDVFPARVCCVVCKVPDARHEVGRRDERGPVVPVCNEYCAARAAQELIAGRDVRRVQ